MNKKDVLKIIKAKADKIEYPDLTDKILSKIDFSNTNVETVTTKEETVVTLAKPRKRTRKVLIPFMATLVASLLLVVLLLFPHHIMPGPDGPKGEETLFSVTKLKTMIGYELYNGASLIEFNSDNAHLNLHRAKNKLESDTESEEENKDESQNSENNELTQTLSNKEIANKIQDAVVASDMLMNKNNFKIKLDKSNKSGYQVAMTCSYKDSDGHKVSYEFFYNETPDHPEDKDYEDIDEVNSTIDGILHIDDKEYRVNGSKEIENNESELELTFFLNNNEYFVVSQEIEVDENEYKYELYKDGESKPYRQIVHSIETENGMKKASYEIKDKSMSVDEVISLEFSNDLIQSKLQISGQEIEVEIEITKQAYIYKFGNETVTIRKNGTTK